MERLESFKKERIKTGLSQFRALPIEVRESKIEIEDRKIKGYAIIWNSINSYREQLIKGSTLNSLNARGVGKEKNKIVLLKHHRTDKPIGNITVLQEDDYGLYFEAEIINTKLGDETLAEIEAGVLRQLSYGFSYVWDKMDYDADSDSYVLREIKLYEISLVTFSSDENAQLRSFGEAQQSMILRDVDSGTLNSIIKIAKIELESRDDHFQKEKKSDESKVTFF